MGYNNWNLAIQNGSVRKDIRDMRRKSGYDPDIKPKHEWLNQNGFSGIQHYAHRKDKTVDQVLIEELGFCKSQYDYGIHHNETEHLVRKFFKEHIEDFDTWNQNTIGPNQSGIKKIAACSREVYGTDNLLRPVRESSEIARKMFKQICKQLEKEVSDGTFNNYTFVLYDFYEYLVEIDYIEENKFEPVFNRQDRSPDREAPAVADIPSATDIRTLFTNGDDTLKTAILLLAAAGDRPKKVVTRTVDEFDFNQEDPCIYSGDENKTGPSANAIMAGREYLQQICTTRQQNQNRENAFVFPSQKGTTPHLSYRVLLDMMKDHAREWDVTKHNGEPITLKSLKQFYLTTQTKADQEFRMTAARRATDAVGDQRAAVKDDHYIPDRQNRDHFRKFAEAKFEVAFPRHVIKIDEINAARTNLDSAQMNIQDFLK